MNVEERRGGRTIGMVYHTNSAITTGMVYHYERGRQEREDSHLGPSQDLEHLFC